MFIDPLNNNNRGGHHRAVAHYIDGKPLKCLILKGEYLTQGRMNSAHNINTTTFRDRPGDMEWHKKNFPEYR